MKADAINHFLLPALIAALGAVTTGRARAQTFTTLHNFKITPSSSYTISDGAYPTAGLILSGNTLYGTTAGGGSSRVGTVFAVNTDGTGFTNLHSFTAASGFPYPNSDGADPQAELILSGNTLYGTAVDGGTSGNGTVFRIDTNGTSFTNLHSFTARPGPLYTNSDGANPYAGLILSGHTLYGTAERGGTSGNGTVFRIDTNGTGFTNLHNFTSRPGPLFTNSDGANPYAGLILSGHTLYGTASFGGSSGFGTVFAVNTDGTDFTTLHSFAAGSGPSSTNSDGAIPLTGLILSGHILYGTAKAGGTSGEGTVFAVNTDGTDFRTLHSFTRRSGFDSTNSDGAVPVAGLILSGHTLYGTAGAGGTSGNGTVFEINTNGTEFTNLHSFAPVFGPLYTNSDAANPQAGLLLSGNTLYGTTSYGGSSGVGTVFSLTLQVLPQLTIVHTAPNVFLTWPTNAAGFTLQSTTNLVSPAVWSTNSLEPVVVNGQNVVTNPASAAQRFYRLIQ